MAVVLSYEDYQASMQTIPFHVATLISKIAPQRCKETAKTMRQHFSSRSGIT